MKVTQKNPTNCEYVDFFVVFSEFTEFCPCRNKDELSVRYTQGSDENKNIQNRLLYIRCQCARALLMNSIKRLPMSSHLSAADRWMVLAFQVDSRWAPEAIGLAHVGYGRYGFHAEVPAVLGSLGPGAILASWPLLILLW